MFRAWHLSPKVSKLSYLYHPFPYQLCAFVTKEMDLVFRPMKEKGDMSTEIQEYTQVPVPYSSLNKVEYLLPNSLPKYESNQWGMTGANGWIFYSLESSQQLPFPPSPCLLAIGGEIDSYAWIDQWVRGRSHHERMPARAAETKKLPQINTVGPSSVRNSGSLPVTCALGLKRTQLKKKEDEEE